MTKSQRQEMLDANLRAIAAAIITARADIENIAQCIKVLEASVERIDADRKTFVRHQQTMARNARKLMAENRAFRAACRQDIRRAAITPAIDIAAIPRGGIIPVLESAQS